MNHGGSTAPNFKLCQTITAARQLALPLLLLLTLSLAPATGEEFERWSVLDGIASSSSVINPVEAGSSDSPVPSPSPAQSPVPSPDKPLDSHSFKSTGGKKSTCEAIACFTDSSCGNAGCGGHTCKKCPTCTGTEASGICVESGKGRSCPAITCGSNGASTDFVPVPSPYPSPSADEKSEVDTPSPSPLPTPSPSPSPKPSPSPSPPPSASPDPPEPQPVAPETIEAAPEPIFQIAPPQQAPPQVVQTEAPPQVVQLPWGAVSVQGQHVQEANGQTYIPVVFAVPTPQPQVQQQQQFAPRESVEPQQPEEPQAQPPPAPQGFQFFNGEILRQLGLTGKR